MMYCINVSKCAGLLYTLIIDIFFKRILLFWPFYGCIDRSASEITGWGGVERAPCWDSNPGLLQRVQNLCTWSAHSTNWANGHPLTSHLSLLEGRYLLPSLYIIRNGFTTEPCEVSLSFSSFRCCVTSFISIVTLGGCACFQFSLPKGLQTLPQLNGVLLRWLS